MKWYPYGHDFGNAEMGGVTALRNGPMLARSIPTAFMKADVTALSGLGVDTASAHILWLQGEEISYAIGELALQQAIEQWNGRGDIQHYASAYSLRGLLTIASSLIPNRDPQGREDHARTHQATTQEASKDEGAILDGHAR